MFSPATRRKRDLLKDTVNKAKDRYRTVSDSKTTGWDFFNKNIGKKSKIMLVLLIKKCCHEY